MSTFEIRNFKSENVMINLDRILLNELNNSDQHTRTRSILDRFISKIHDGAAELQYADLFMGNPGDISYKSERCRSVYLGTLARNEKDLDPSLHYWLVINNQNKLIVAETYGDSNRSTCAFMVIKGSHWVDMGVPVTEEEFLRDLIKTEVTC